MDLSPTLQTVLLSLGTSLIVSVITFILGLKSGKNQADRAKLQDLYKQLHSHFSDLKESLLQNRPKSWSNYKKVEKGLHSIEYFPPVKEMKKTGDLLFIKKKIAKEAVELEMHLMNYSHNLSYNIPKLHAALISDLGLYKEGYTFKKYQGCEDETAHFETANPAKCNTSRTSNYRAFYDKERIIKVLNEFDKDASCAIEFTSGGNPPSYSFKIYPHGLTVDIEEYIGIITDRFKTSIAEYERSCVEKDRLIAQIDKLNKKIERRVREPVSFWETMFGAFADMFR